MSYYESRIKALEARIEEMSQLERMKAVKVEAQLMVTISELQAENARLKAEVERLKVILEGHNDVAQQAAEIIVGRIEDAVKELRADVMNAAKEGKQP